MVELPSKVPPPRRRFSDGISKALKNLPRLLQYQDNSIPPQANATCFFYLNDVPVETELDQPTDEQTSEPTTMSWNACPETPRHPSDTRKIGIGMRLKTMLKKFFSYKESVISPKLTTS